MGSRTHLAWRLSTCCCSRVLACADCFHWKCAVPLCGRQRGIPTAPSSSAAMSLASSKPGRRRGKTSETSSGIRKQVICMLRAADVVSCACIRVPAAACMQGGAARGRKREGKHYRYLRNGHWHGQYPVNVDRALMTVTPVTDFLQNGSNWVRAYS